MNRRSLVIIAAGLAVLAAAIATLNRSGTRPRPHEAATTTAAPPLRAAAEPPKAEPPPAAPAPAPRSTRREPARKPVPSSPATPAPVAAAPAAGTLHIDSDVPGARVFIDREYIGATPVTATNVKPGAHRLNVSAQGFEGIADTIEVAPGTRDIVVRLKDVRLDAAIDVVHKHRFGSCRGRLIATPRGLRYETANKDDAFSSAATTLPIPKVMPIACSRATS